MRNHVGILCVVLLLAGLFSGSAFAQNETGHYVSGVEGIKAATLPPPGFYYRMYHVYYAADELLDDDGDDLNIGFDAEVYAFVNRFIWISKYELLGGSFGADIIIPAMYTDLEIKAVGVGDDQFGLGDVCIEPLLLSWHGPKYDAAFALGLYVPIGEYDKDDPASPGKDMWTVMATAGGTYYFDKDKTISASVLARYETHSEKDETDVTPGDDFHFEWGVGKTFAKTWDVGLAGYCHWQVTDDSGSDVFWDDNIHDRTFAIGPEIGGFFPQYKLGFTLRHEREFAVKDRSEGHITALTLTFMF